MIATEIVATLKKAGERALSTGDYIAFDETLKRMEVAAEELDGGVIEEAPDPESQKTTRKRKATKGKSEEKEQEDDEKSSEVEAPEEVVAPTLPKKNPWDF